MYPVPSTTPCFEYYIVKRTKRIQKFFYMIAHSETQASTLLFSSWTVILQIFVFAFLRGVKIILILIAITWISSRSLVQHEIMAVQTPRIKTKKRATGDFETVLFTETQNLIITVQKSYSSTVSFLSIYWSVKRWVIQSRKLNSNAYKKRFKGGLKTHE